MNFFNYPVSEFLPVSY